jgi:hypothetical protein
MGTTHLFPSALLLSFVVFVVLYVNYIHTFPNLRTSFSNNRETKYRVDSTPCYLYYNCDVFMILQNLVFNKNLRTGIAVC